MGMWNITLLVGKDHDLVCEMEKSELDYSLLCIHAECRLWYQTSGLGMVSILLWSFHKE